MPWKDHVPAILEAFYPGIRGGAAIARILTGKVDPSGHLPISFPASAEQLARADLPGLGQPDGTPVHVSYDEGAAIGYKWYDMKGYRPLWAFGRGQAHGSPWASWRRGRTGGGSASLPPSATSESARARALPRCMSHQWTGKPPVGGTETAGRVHQGRVEARPGKDCRTRCRSALARDVRSGRKQLAHPGRHRIMSSLQRRRMRRFRTCP